MNCDIRTTRCQRIWDFEANLYRVSKANEAAFLSAIEGIAKVSSEFLDSLESNAPPKNREEEAATAKARAAQRFGG